LSYTHDTHIHTHRGYARNGGIGDYQTIDQLLQELISTVACNGNFLLNVGPTRFAP
jgi:alpha-L-fucosidase